VWDTTSTTTEAVLLLALPHLTSTEPPVSFVKLEMFGMERNVLLLHQLTQIIPPIPQIQQIPQILPILLLLKILPIHQTQQTPQGHPLLQFTSPALQELTGIVNNYVAYHAKQAVPLALIAIHALLAVWDTFNKKVTHSVMRSVVMEKDTFWDVMMATLLMEMAAAVAVKYRLGISVPVVHRLLLMFAPELFLGHSNSLQAGNPVFGVELSST